MAPVYEASIRDDEGADVPPAMTGRLWIKSPSNMIGYWNRPDATAETIVDGWLDTGDLVAVDEEDYLWFRGRKKQIIIHDGSNICPQEVEESLLGMHGRRRRGRGRRPRSRSRRERCGPTWSSGRVLKRPTIAELIEFSRARVGYKAPDEIVVLDEMPTNAVGKVDRVALKQMADAAINRHLP